MHSPLSYTWFSLTSGSHSCVYTGICTGHRRPGLTLSTPYSYMLQNCLCLQSHKRKKYSPSQDIIFIPSMRLTNIRLVKSCYHTSQWIETKASLYMILSWVDWRNALGSVWLHSLLLSKYNLGQNRKAPSANFMINRFQEQAILQSTLRQQYIKLCIKTMGSFKIKSKCQA